MQVPPGGGRIALSFDQLEYLGFDPSMTRPKPLGLVGRSGDGPIRWDVEEETTPYTHQDYTLTLLVDAWTPRADLLDDAVETGTHPFEDREDYLAHRYEIAWEVTEAGPYVFQFTNAHPRTATAYDLALSLEPLAPETATDPGLSTTGTGATDAAGEGKDPGGCGCGGGRGVGLAGLLADAIAVRRRRGSAEEPARR